MINHGAPPIMRRLTAPGLALTLAAFASLGFGGQASAQNFGMGGYSFQTGEELYKGICQGCHMPDGKGASGAGAYPALAGNKKLGSKAYPEMVVLKGQKAMPSFESFTDAQTAAVINYVRTHFGNDYKDAVTPEEVKAMRAVVLPKAVSSRAPG